MQQSQGSPTNVDWKPLDDPLCRLVDQPGCDHEVEVDFRFTEAGVIEVDELTGELKIARSLAKFRRKGKGRIRVIRVGPGGSESVVYSSDGIT